MIWIIQLKFAIEGYKINVERYFIKPINQSEFNLEMQIIIKKYCNNQLGFFDSKICNGKIYFKDIIYIESINRKTNIHFFNEKIVQTTYSMRHWDEVLILSFFAHPCKSFITNLNYVSGLEKKNIILLNEECIPLSRKYKNQFIISYKNYLHEVL